MFWQAKYYIYVCLVVILTNYAAVGKALPTELSSMENEDVHYVEVEELVEPVSATESVAEGLTNDDKDNVKDTEVSYENNDNVSEDETTVTNVVQETNDDEEESSGHDNVPVELNEESTTLANAEDSVSDEQESEEEHVGEDELTTVTQEVEEVEEMTTLAPTCDVVGVKAHETNCHLYYSCSPKDMDDDSTLYLSTMSCAENEAFNEKWNRCARDLSSCTDNAVTCMAAGSVPDPTTNTSYYICYPRLETKGYLLYHVNCAKGEVYVPALGKCFIDLTDFANAYLNYDWTQPHDIDVVKAEMKEYKAEVKLQMKLEKEKAKMEKKLQKELEKLAKKKAKEEEKAKKEAEKLATAA